MLVHAKKVVLGKNREPDNATTIRRTEMLKHFPIVARQFSFEGQLMDQNPEAQATFGNPSSGQPPETERRGKSTHTLNSKNAQPDETSQQGFFLRNHTTSQLDGSMRSATSSLFDESTRSLNLCDFLAQFRIRDPVTSELVIIYSGRDITKVMESAKLEADKQNMKRNEFCKYFEHDVVSNVEKAH
jgi:hypothetical protein